MSSTVMQQTDEPLGLHTGPEPDALVVTTSTGTPVLSQNFIRRIWLAAVREAGPSAPDAAQHAARARPLLIAGVVAVGQTPSELKRLEEHTQQIEAELRLRPDREAVRSRRSPDDERRA